MSILCLGGSRGDTHQDPTLRRGGQETDKLKNQTKLTEEKNVQNHVDKNQSKSNRNREDSVSVYILTKVY